MVFWFPSFGPQMIFFKNLVILAIGHGLHLLVLTKLFLCSSYQYDFQHQELKHQHRESGRFSFKKIEQNRRLLNKGKELTSNIPN